MRVNQNLMALNAHRNFTQVNSALSKSLERLSSGLRINRAADDAAGLAISEKMRAQIRGLTQASRNAQDGISLIQTAEGALSEIHSMLQRMRELAAQAATDTLTANDRVQIQAEIDQLKAEINRVARTTEFNKQKLLDGTAAALVSTDKATTQVFARGSIRGAAGNYQLVITAAPGQAEILQTDVFKVYRAEGQVVISSQASWITNITESNMLATGTLTQSGTTYQLSINFDLSVAANAAATPLEWYRATRNSVNLVGAPTVSSGTNVNASLLFEVTAKTSNAVQVTIRSWELESDGDTNYVFQSGIFLNSGNNTVTIGRVKNLAFALTSLANVSVGDKWTVQVTRTYTAASDSVTLVDQRRSANVFSMEWSFTNLSAAGTYTLKLFQLDHTTGEVRDATLTFTKSAYNTDGLAGNIYVTGAQAGDLAGLSTRLSNIDRFYDANGRFLLDQPQTITLMQGDGKSTTVTLYAYDTIKDVMTKLEDAIKNGLGQGDVAASATTGQWVTYVQSGLSTPNSPEAVSGTFVIRSAIAGSGGEIKFTGDEDVVNALSLTVIQASEENQFSVTVKDATTGDALKKDVEITGNLLPGAVHANVDVKFDPMAGIKTTYDSTTKKFSMTGGTDTTTIHIADSSLVFQVGANEAQTMDAAIGRMDAAALNVDAVIVTDRDSASKAITTIDQALERVSGERSRLGAIQNRLEHTIANLGVAAENTTAAESRIRDVDMAQEMIQFTRLQVLNQAGIAMLAQANTIPSYVLQLLR